MQFPKILGIGAYEMNKYIKDGKVAVLISPGFGAGWYSWSENIEDCLFDADIVKLVLDKNALEKACSNHFYNENRNSINEIIKNIKKLAKEKFGEDFFAEGARDLIVEWVDEGEMFEIREYDGAESLILQEGKKYITA